VFTPDTAQQAFLTRSLLDIRGIWTLSDSLGVVKKARASRDLQERALGVEAGRLNEAQDIILRAVARKVRQLPHRPLYP